MGKLLADYLNSLRENAKEQLAYAVITDVQQLLKFQMTVQVIDDVLGLPDYLDKFKLKDEENKEQ